MLFVDDFNCPQSHTVFNPIKKMGYLPIFTNQKTSLKKECKEDDCLASEFDNIWYNSSKIKIQNANIIYFYKDFVTLLAARKISDHVPVIVEINLQ